MSRRQVVACCLSFALSGCAMWNGMTGRIGDQSEPEVEGDKWESVGKEARHGYPREEADWFERNIWSEKARDINRSLGYD